MSALVARSYTRRGMPHGEACPDYLARTTKHDRVPIRSSPFGHRETSALPKALAAGIHGAAVNALPERGIVTSLGRCKGTCLYTSKVAIVFGHALSQSPSPRTTTSQIGSIDSIGHHHPHSLDCRTVADVQQAIHPGQNVHPAVFARSTHKPPRIGVGRLQICATQNMADCMPRSMPASGCR
jgi:hypothetical protein